MQLYTMAHIAQVFILGILHGLIIGSFIMSKIKSRYRTRTKSKVISYKRVIPTGANSEYQRLA